MNLYRPHPVKITFLTLLNCPSGLCDALKPDHAQNQQSTSWQRVSFVPSLRTMKSDSSGLPRRESFFRNRTMKYSFKENVKLKK